MKRSYPTKSESYLYQSIRVGDSFKILKTLEFSIGKGLSYLHSDEGYDSEIECSRRIKELYRLELDKLA